MSEPETPVETDATPDAEATNTPATEPTLESDAPQRPVLISRLIPVIGHFLSKYFEKEKEGDEVSEEMSHLMALFSQHILLVNSINADPELAASVIAAVDKEISAVTEETGVERKPLPLSEEPSNIIVPNRFGA